MMPFRSSLIWLGIGGLTLFWCLFVFIFQVQSPHLPLTYLLLLLSFPHFFQTFFLYYRNTNLLKKYRFLSFVFPVLLAFIVFSIHAKPAQIFLVHLAQVFFFWHIAKQSFGVSWFFLEKEFKTPLFRNLLLTVCMSWALVGWLVMQTSQSIATIFEFYSPMMGLPAFLWQTVLAISAALTVGFFTLYTTQKKALPNLLFSTTVIAHLLWLIPGAGVYDFALIALFHGLQYSVFYVLYLGRDTGAMKVAGISVLTVFFGWLFFLGAPQLIAQSTMSAWLVSAIFVFLNVHHYFLDAVLWKKDNNPMIHG